MKALIDGYRRFRANAWLERRRLFETLAVEGQAPRALVIACADSRVDPAMIFDAAPGELFIVRNVANLVPPYAPDAAFHGTSAAIEFAVCVLEVPDIVVLGHANCGGVKALLEGVPDTARDFVGPWISIARDIRARVLTCSDDGERATMAEQETVKLSLDTLMTFPWIASRVAAGRLRLHGAHFGIYNGMLSVLQVGGSFQPV
ncbi:MAG: carbonic anhydrase [Acetobacteraceae bacterium]|nr:carbonic anhydrase [Acetobacteraceae bacterium]